MAFKPETDDVREAPSFYLIKKLIDQKFKVSAHDPKAIENSKSEFNCANLSFHSDRYDAVNNADCLVLLTEWQEYKTLNFKKLSKLMKNRVLFDGRNIYSEQELKSNEFSYFQVGVKNEEHE